MSTAHSLLAQLRGLLAAAELDDKSIGPSAAFDGRLQEQWQRLKKEIDRELRKQLELN